MKVCKKCLLPETFPNIAFDEQGVCNFCNSYTEKKKNEFTNIFKDEAELKQYLKKYTDKENKYDILLAVSGGIDSCNALVELVTKYKLRPLVYHNEDGHVNKVASSNVKKICKALDVDLVIWQHDMEFMRKMFCYMNESDLHISTCNLCGTILYLNNIELATKFKIPIIINGFSKGAASMIGNRETFHNIVDLVVREAVQRGDKQFAKDFYKKFDYIDQHNILRSKEDFQKSQDEKKPLFIPFYVFDFNKLNKVEHIKKLSKEYGWEAMPTSYPHKSSNCDMIWINTYSDLKKMHYTYFTEEYSQLIREGEFTREEAWEDLFFNPPKGLLKRTAEHLSMDTSKVPEDICLDCFGQECSCNCEKQE